MKQLLSITTLFLTMMVLQSGATTSESANNASPSSKAAQSSVKAARNQPPSVEIALVANAQDGTVALVDVATRSVLGAIDVNPGGVKKEGPAFKDGLLHYLLEDVEDGEMREEWKVKPPKVLAELFPGVDPAKPFLSEAVTQGDQSRFIDAIGKYHSPAVDAAVFKQFKELGSGRFKDHGDEYFALSCMAYLIGRGHDAEFKAYCERRIPKSEYHAKELQAMLDRLK